MQEKTLANDSAENEQNKPLTPGERLAAAQAAKAARKAAARGRDAEELEEKALAQAAVARDWMQENLKPILLGAGVVVLLAALVLGWRGISHKQASAGGSELAAVLEELNVWNHYECLSRRKRAGARNILDVRFVGK